MDGDSSAENISNAPEFVCQSPQVLDFNEKRLQWASVVRELYYYVHSIPSYKNLNIELFPLNEASIIFQKYV